MARWATITETANYMRVKPQTIYNAITRKKPLGMLFKKAESCTKVADLDEIDAYLKGAGK